ncbi:MAG: hypothetical protein KDE33_01950 [Bacteroidetes bacterium]|nr:hypothetical protein [Bacteroidota bacterium]
MPKRVAKRLSNEERVQIEFSRAMSYNEDSVQIIHYSKRVIESILNYIYEQREITPVPRSVGDKISQLSAKFIIPTEILKASFNHINIIRNCEEHWREEILLQMAISVRCNLFMIYQWYMEEIMEAQMPVEFSDWNAILLAFVHKSYDVELNTEIYKKEKRIQHLEKIIEGMRKREAQITQKLINLKNR